jgi:rare lipoprotein A
VAAQPTPDHWTGMASYYHQKFEGCKTSSGAVFCNDELTAANNFLPFGSKVRVTNLRNKKTVIVLINDRMNRKNKRLIDLSAAAARQLGFYRQGLCKVRVELLSSSNVK